MTCRDKMEHAAAGAAVGLVVRGPWFAESWRDHAWKRVGWVAVLGATYEYFQYLEHKAMGRLGNPGFGFSPLDIGADVAGAIALELVAGVGKLIW